MEKIDEIKITEKVKEISGDKFNSKKSQIRLIGTPDYIAP